MIARSLTAEEFAECRYDLAEGGQWAELIAGQPVELHPPEDAHGTAIMNLSKALADWVEQFRAGYACFEHGLIIKRNPDTVYCPPISYFDSGDRWAEMDRPVTESRPALVVEVPSTPDRARLLTDRITQYREWGVAVLWVVEPQTKRITVYSRNPEPTRLTQEDTLASDAGWEHEDDASVVLPEFSLPVEQIFRAPDWWTNPRRTEE